MAPLSLFTASGGHRQPSGLGRVEGWGQTIEPAEIVAAFRRLGGLYRRAVLELDAHTLRSFFLARAEALIHLPDAELLEVLAAEVTQQAREAEQLLADLRAIGTTRRRRAPALRLFRSHVDSDLPVQGLHDQPQLDA